MIDELQQQIDKLKQQNKQLTEQAYRSNLAIDGAGLGTWDWDLTSSVVIFNHIWAKSLGYCLEDIKPHVDAWRELLHPEDVERVNQSLEQNLSGKTQLYDTRHRLRAKNNEWIWVRARGKVAERGPDGTPLRHCGSCLVIEELKAVESQLEASEERYQDLFNHSVEAIIVTDAKGTVTSFNQSAQTLFGYRQNEVIGHNINLLVPDENKSQHDGYINQYHNTQRSQIIGTGREVEGQHKDGHLIALYISISQSNYHNQQRFMAMVHDITDAKNTQRLLEEREKNFRFFANASFEAIAIHDRGLVIHANDRFHELFQYEKHELINVQVLPLLLTPESLKITQEHIANQSTDPYEVECIRKDGTHFPAEILPRIDVLNGKLIRATAMRDITEHKQQQKRLQIAKEQAEQASKAKSQFLSSMSHELRTPLNSIMGFAQLFQLDAEATDKIIIGAAEILKGGKHLLSLINDILDLAKIESDQIELNLEPVKIDGVLNDCLHFVRQTALQQGIGLDLIHSDSLAKFVYADKIKLKQVLLNLLSNAIKYNVENGKVVVDCQVTGPLLTIKVTDTGRGLSAAQIDALFQPFNRLGVENSNIQGTGIGLVITKQLLEKMHGKIGVESELSKGTTFWCQLPLTTETQDDKAPTLLPNSHLAIGPTRHVDVLYVEDNVANRLVMQSILDARENTLLNCVDSAEQAMIYLNKVQPNNIPDLILLDINLPGMDGYQFFNLLQNSDQFKHIPIIAVTAKAMIEDMRNAEQFNFSAYLAKPIIIDQLYRSIELALT